MTQTRLLRTCKLCMLFAGNWRMPFFKDKFVQNLYFFYAHVIRYYHIYILIVVAMEIIALFLSGDISSATYNLTLFLTGVLVATKTVLLRRPNISKLIRIIFDTEQTILLSDDGRELIIYEDLCGYADKMSKAIIYWVIWFTVCGTLTPVFFGIITDSKTMIFAMYTPFNQEDHYGVSVIIQGFGILSAAILYCASQGFYISVTVFVIIRLKLLQLKCQYFDEYKRDTSDMDFTKTIVKEHQSIITFLQEFDAAIKLISLFEFMVSSINIAAALFQIVDGGDLRELTFAASNCVLLISQLFILSWHANEIAVESLKVSTALYEFPWYNKSANVCRMLLLVHMRAQKPLTLSLGPFGILTNATAIKVMNTAYSYMTVMAQN